ncbi:MAG: S-methyl-5-thioribose-1-phosphate isomerase [Candidatus Omnitrophica bacterium]|nr:S-methyl-5-thioribose-1-phosphate isomerase [Candidatus Omnitrophota bacterium]
MKLNIKETPLFWPAKLRKGVLFVLDETLIPRKLRYVKVLSAEDAVKVIREMKTRAFGQLLVVLYTFIVEIYSFKGKSSEELLQRVKEVAVLLNNSRPTFPFSEVTSMVVGVAQGALHSGSDMANDIRRFINGYLKGIRWRRIERVMKIARYIKDGDSILTHCNVSGELAMAAYICSQQNKDIHFFVTETRPYLQGSKLTCWELKRMKAKVTLIADNAVGTVMSDSLVNKVIVGSDRSCANHDFANKIGTYQIAVLAKEFGIPFCVLTQPSDKIKKGEDIPIEIRSPKEILLYEGKKTVPGAEEAFYPGFDIVPNKYINKEIPINVR